jgi:hypothetical protein
VFTGSYAVRGTPGSRKHCWYQATGAATIHKAVFVDVRTREG